MDAWHRRPSLCCAAVPNKPRRLLDWSAPCACRRTAALRHNERQQAFPGQALDLGEPLWPVNGSRFNAADCNTADRQLLLPPPPVARKARIENIERLV